MSEIVLTGEVGSVPIEIAGAPEQQDDEEQDDDPGGGGHGGPPEIRASKPRTLRGLLKTGGARIAVMRM
jgi:hypothetical protein